jgi:hypothetical protein
MGTMPFHVRDPWRKQYFEGVSCPDDVHVPIDDIDCHDWFPEYRFVYDKLFVARSQGLACGTAHDLPGTFPVFAKPQVNLKGMGLGSLAIRDGDSFATHMQPGMMWMTLLEGAHVSTDCAVVKGEVRWIRQATGLAFGEGMFKHWIIHAEDDSALSAYITDWVAAVLPRYTGMINVETIGGRIIEAQIRFADQWCDLYGQGWLEAVAQLYSRGEWQFSEGSRREGFSIPLFAAHGLVPPYPPDEAQRAIRTMPDVASLQITYHAGKAGEDHPMPPGGFRLGIVNAWDLAAGHAAKRVLAAAFEDVEILDAV